MLHINNNEAQVARRQPGYDPFVNQNLPVIDTLNYIISGHLHIRTVDY
jgi:hypothetical protein